MREAERGREFERGRERGEREGERERVCVCMCVYTCVCCTCAGKEYCLVDLDSFSFELNGPQYFISLVSVFSECFSLEPGGASAQERFWLRTVSSWSSRHWYRTSPSTRSARTIHQAATPGPTDMAWSPVPRTTRSTPSHADASSVRVRTGFGCWAEADHLT